MAIWHIVVEAEDGRRERVGEPSGDLVGLTARAVGLADELGRLPRDDPHDRLIDLVTDDGRVELSIMVLPGGLDPPGDAPG